MLLSAKAPNATDQAADRAYVTEARDARSLLDMIRQEVDHATEALAARAHRAEAQLREYARRAKHDAKTTGRHAVSVVRANPLPTGLMALGAGLILAAFLVPKHHA